MEKHEIEQKMKDIETQMSDPTFWDDKEHAQKVVQEYEDLKKKREGVGKYDKNDAVITIRAGAGGDDAEDFVRMLLSMYLKYAENQGWQTFKLHEHATENDGYRNVTLEVKGKGKEAMPYGTLQHETGVHRLVRISPFNANKKRHTSFAMVEVLPRVEERDTSHINIPDSDLEVQFAKSSGPGGQNANKRETAVRMTHIPTGATVHVESERTQEGNRTKAKTLLKGKLVQLLEEQEKEELSELEISKDTSNEWGSQIRSYVLHPYKLVKDHRTGTELHDVEKVLENGEIDAFIKAVEQSNEEESTS